MTDFKAHNPLKIPILALLQKSSNGYSIHQLVNQLQRENDLKALLTAQSNIDLFKINFLAMNALFQIQDELAKENWRLEISSMHIALEKIICATTEFPAQSSGSSKLRDYYLDWKNLEEIKAEEVEALLQSFWQYYMQEDQQSDALKILELKQGATLSEIKQQYRKLANSLHPDKGGTTEKFVQLRWAYEILIL